MCSYVSVAWQAGNWVLTLLTHSWHESQKITVSRPISFACGNLFNGDCKNMHIYAKSGANLSSTYILWKQGRLLNSKICLEISMEIYIQFAFAWLGRHAVFGFFFTWKFIFQHLYVVWLTNNFSSSKSSVFYLIVFIFQSSLTL